jgi:hypothetical protein
MISKLAKKIFNTKFALILMENFLKSQQVDSLIKTRNELKNEIENRQKKSVNRKMTSDEVTAECEKRKQRSKSSGKLDEKI